MFTSSTKYAIRSIIHLSKMEPGYVVTVEEMANALDIPKAYLSKILQQLSRSKIISSKKGKGGGFFLTKENLNRSLIDVVLCIEGHNVFDQCVLGLPTCSDSNQCILHGDFKKFKNDLQDKITKESIGHLVELYG